MWHRLNHSKSKNIKTASLVQKLQQFCRMDRFCLLLELYQEGHTINRVVPSSFFLYTQVLIHEEEKTNDALSALIYTSV